MNDTLEIKEGDTLMIGVALAESNTAPYPVTVRLLKGSGRCISHKRRNRESHKTSYGCTN